VRLDIGLGRAAGKAEETAERVPGHVVAVGRENSAVSDDGEDHEHGEGEETHAGFEGGTNTRTARLWKASSCAMFISLS